MTFRWEMNVTVFFKNYSNNVLLLHKDLFFSLPFVIHCSLIHNMAANSCAVISPHKSV